MKKIEYLIELLEKSIKKEKPFINKYESISGISLNRCQNIKDMIELDIYNLSFKKSNNSNTKDIHNK